MKNYYVYVHKDRSGKVFYVGKGCDRRAWSNRRSELWKRYVNKHGLIVEIYRDNLQEWYALELEKDLITKYGMINQGGQLVNFVEGGGRLSSGTKYDYETCKKISYALKGKPKSAEHRKNLSIATKLYNALNNSPRKGKSHCQETKDKISIANRGKLAKGKNPFAKKIVCVETGVIFDSLVEAADWYKSIGFLKAHANNIGRVLTGKFKQYLGYTWIYYKGC